MASLADAVFGRLRLKEGSQRAQYPLIKEYTLHHTIKPLLITAIFLNSGVLGSLEFVSFRTPCSFLYVSVVDG